MQQTTCGEIPKKKKVSVYNRSNIESFLEKNSEQFKNTVNQENFLYSGGVLIKDSVANYLNVKLDCPLEVELKNILAREYLKAEKLYPKLGSYFISSYFGDHYLEHEDDYFLHKDSLEIFLETIENSHVRRILNFLIEHSSLEYSLEVKSTSSNQISAIKSKDINFRITYDSSYLGQKNSHQIRNFKYIIIDGQIESIGEIYHLLYKAAETKVPYVIFCFGVSREVKDVILQNNSKGNTEIIPVCLKFDENTINILNDLSIVLGGDIVTAQKGQTISQEIKKELKVGKFINFDRNGFMIQPNVPDERINNHRRFLEKRIESSSNDTNRELLINRKRRMSCKSMKLYIPDFLLKDPDFYSELDYGLRFFSNSSKIMKLVSNRISSCKFFIPKMYIPLIDRKIKSLKKTYSNIDKAIIWEKNNGRR